MRTLIPVSLIVVLILVIGWLLSGHQQGELENNKKRGGDFTLQSLNGPVSLSDYRGKVVLIYFGYTWCPDICPTNLALISAAFSAMQPDELEQVQGIFVSVDPQRDSVERLNEYTQFFHENIMGITGSETEVAELAGRYGVSYRLFNQDSATSYVVDHSSETYVINPQGELVEILPHAAQSEKISQSILRHLPAKQH